jgi:PhnB protein
MPVSPFPAGYSRITPYLVMQGAAQAIDFYTKHFDAVEIMRMPGPGGTVGHAELKIGDAIFMLADEMPDRGFRGPKAFGGSPVSLLLYVEDVDAVVAAAVSAGSTLLRPVADQFYGDRTGTLTDPFGHTWTIATHKEDVAPDEMQRRMAAMGS